MTHVTLNPRVPRLVSASQRHLRLHHPVYRAVLQHLMTPHARLLIILSVPPGALMYSLATADHTYSLPHVALDWQSLPERLCSRTPASTVLYRTGHSVMNYSFAVVLCVSESVKDIFRLHACLQDSSLFPHLLITTWPSTTADYG
ncbi:hypothetical protein J6590_077504 [Homalodisca vitripennis]|nr:hypothetical protein J6590_077504 [Homalodisca vitripennis]